MFSDEEENEHYMRKINELQKRVQNLEEIVIRLDDKGRE